jgi:hypothetical protein
MRRWRTAAGATFALIVALGRSPASAPQNPVSGGVTTPALPTEPARQSPRNANYSITARLDPATHTIAGSETIEWRNITSRATSELQVHLYWNAWRDERSTWQRERGLSTRVRPPGNAASHIDIRRLTVRGADAANDLTSRLQFIAPDDGNADDRTVVKVDLPRAAAPGERLRIEDEWDAVVPGPFARTSHVGDFYFIAQWFPKLGVLQEDGWNCHQFHFSTEFFSDYGMYDVKLTVPRGWLVGATGREQSQSDGTNGRTHHYIQEDVHDFAWTTSPDYVERTGLFDEPGLPRVDMRLLLQPEHVAQADRHFAAAASALRRYGQWFGPYPYGHLTIVDPAYLSEADGMEYPTLITAGTRWLTPREVTINTPEEVTAHEAGHQFWYGLVGTNEFEDAWMDEGINTYATARAMAEDYPRSFHEERYFGGFVPWVFRDLPLTRETFWNRLAGYRRDPEGDAASTPAYRFYPPTGRTITYNKTALWLNTLERWIGWEHLQPGLSAFFKQSVFGHPKPDAFFATVSAARPLRGATARELFV